MHFLFLQILPQSTVMASYLIALALVAVCLPFAAPQEAAPVGSCSRLEVSNFFTLIPNPAVCGPAVDRFYNGTNVTDAEFQAAVNATCTADCGGAFARFTYEVCDDFFVGASLRTFCLPTRDPETGRDRCRYFAPDRINASIIADLWQCAAYNPETPNTCPDGCVEAFRAFTEEVGCCYQHFYNDSISLAAFVETSLLTSEQASLFMNISSTSLQSACGINETVVPVPCVGLGEPFSGNPTLISGVCGLEQIAGAVSGEEACMAGLADIFGDPEQVEAGDLEEAFDAFCTEECGGVISTLQEGTCLSPFGAQRTLALCYSAAGTSALGPRCGFSIGEHVEAIFEGVGGACFFDYMDPDAQCPSSCMTQLQNVHTQFGCCFQEIYNNTNLVDLFILEGVIRYNEREFFMALGDDALWDKCGVETIDSCVGDPLAVVDPTEGAVQFTASLVIVFVVSAFALLL